MVQRQQHIKERQAAFSLQNQHLSSMRQQHAKAKTGFLALEPAPFLDVLQAQRAAATDYLAERTKGIGNLERKKKAAAWDTWGQGFFKQEPSIAPLRGALAVWGLGIDDIGVASFHGAGDPSHQTQPDRERWTESAGQSAPVTFFCAVLRACEPAS